MSEKTFAIVTTTIRKPTLLAAYFEDAQRFYRTIEQCIVVGDRKTPPEVAVFCKELAARYAVPCVYLSPDDQEQFLSRWPEFRSFLPWNSIQRRNVGLRYAAMEGAADIVVTIDDDNFLCQPDYFGHHAHVGGIEEFETVHSQSGWWNVCEMLRESRNIPFYHRGHPWSQRWTDGEQYQARTNVRGFVAVNAGLWLDDPDVDALTRLFAPVRAIGTSEKYRARLGCAHGTWAPFNSQNTAIARSVLPAYFLFPFVGRYDDIWASYLIRYIADYRREYVTYGAPQVRQQRNPHNYLRDFDDERLGMECTDTFLAALRRCTLTADSYAGCFHEIAQQFPAHIMAVCIENSIDVTRFQEVIRGFRVWSATL